jgi:hypothetical protein
VNGIHKLVYILELLVHRGVPQIGHFIDRAQFFEHFGTDYGRWNFASARFELVDNLVYRIFQGKKAGGTFFERFRDAGGQFATIKWFMGSVTFHHAQIGALDFFVRRKAILALQAFATTPDTGAIPRLTGIDDLVITRPALGATHSMEMPITIPLVVVSMLLCIFRIAF